MNAKYPLYSIIGLSAVVVLAFFVSSAGHGKDHDSTNGKTLGANSANQKKDSNIGTPPVVLDTLLYNKALIKMTNGDSSGRWPVKTAYPLAGAILPFKRIVAYYGNLYSKKMGVLGEYPTQEMLQRLRSEIKKWQMADSAMPVLPALHYIALTAQGSPGKNGKYSLRMPSKQIDSIIRVAAQINAIVFLDIQVGLSNVQTEIPLLEKYLQMPQVHLGLDPEFSMKTGKKPGTVIGTMDATDVNFASEYLAKLVVANHLPPKILVVHRFTHAMLTNYKKIQTRPEVQIVMDMDGWGVQSKKLSTYHDYIYREPVQFTGFKLFYKNDFREAKSRMLTPEEVLRLKPQPVYIQYQ
jgi:hypothetical protein